MTKIQIDLNEELTNKLNDYRLNTGLSKTKCLSKVLDYALNLSKKDFEDMLLGRNVDMPDQPIKDQPIKDEPEEPDKPDKPHKETFEEFKANSRAEYEEKKKGNWNGLRPHDNDYDFKE